MPLLIGLPLARPCGSDVPFTAAKPELYADVDCIPGWLSDLIMGGATWLTAVKPEGWLTAAKPPLFTAVKPDEDTGLGCV